MDIEKGLRQKHFPIRVRYILTSDTFVKAAEAAEKPQVEVGDLFPIYVHRFSVMSSLMLKT